jgi:ribonuclease J
MGNEGIDIFISDSTNAMRPNHSPSETGILKDIEKFIKEAKKKVIVAAFASNLLRVQAIIELAEKNNKKVCVFGRSMVNGIKIAKILDYLNVKETTLIDKKQIGKYDDNELVILTTGSQGEELAALNRMADGLHAQIQIQPDDLIIFSSSPIPGNRIRIENLINKLYKKGAIIKEHGVDGILHTSGHAYKDEHIKIFGIAKPKYFIPYHGTYRMSRVHCLTAIECGVKPENNFVVDNGDVVYMENHKV